MTDRSTDRLRNKTLTDATCTDTDTAESQYRRKQHTQSQHVHLGVPGKKACVMQQLVTTVNRTSVGKGDRMLASLCSE